jgi:hypothetical protein
LYVGTGPADKMITGRNKIIHLRQNYHFGPAKIQMYLKRYHDVEISSSGVWRILKRLDLNRLSASQRYQRRCGSTTSGPVAEGDRVGRRERGSSPEKWHYPARVHLHKQSRDHQGAVPASPPPAACRRSSAPTRRIQRMLVRLRAGSPIPVRG